MTAKLIIRQKEIKKRNKAREKTHKTVERKGKRRNVEWRNINQTKIETKSER